MTSKGKFQWRSLLRWLPGVLISLVAIGMIVKLAKWEDLGPAFQTYKIYFWVIAAVSTLTFTICRAMASRVLLENKASFKQALLAVNEGYLLNNLFPLRAGEIGRAILLGRATGLGTFHVLSTIVIERVFDLAFAAGLLLLTLPLVLQMDWIKPAATITFVIVLIGIVAMYLMAHFQMMVNGWVNKIGERWSFFKKVIAPRLSTLLAGLTVLKDPRRFFLSFFWVGMSWLVAEIMYWVMMLPVAPQAPFWWGVFTNSVLAMGIALPAAPASIGVFEGSIIAATTVFGISASMGLAYALSIHITQFVVTGVIGIYGLWKDGQSLGALFRATQTDKNPAG